MTQVSRSDWINAGINQLRQYGPGAVSGEKLARRMDVTRGSFYHHFKSMDAFIELLMDEWERTYTWSLLEQAHNHANDPASEMTLLLEAAWNSDQQLEIAVRQWAFTHALVQARVERIDSIRLTHLTNLYSTLINNPLKGAQFAKIAYYGLIGAMHGWPRPTRQQLRALILEIQALLLTEL